ncbi:MAG TPA: hypothetical protein VK690_03375 [Stellaceae bacterium]|nr:hypothetical protein [Stellaceae bacterium]
MLTRRMLLWVLAVSWLPVPALAQSAVNAAQIEAMLDGIAAGRDSAFTQPLAPAWSLNAALSTPDRIREIDARMAQEIERVVTAFVNAPAGGKIDATRAVVAQIDAETARDGAAQIFEGSGPGLGVIRQLLFVPAAAAGANPVETLMRISSQFMRSPKTDDVYYEYSNPADLKKSSVLELPGSDTSWTSGARPPMAPGAVYALKKCRNILILGWYCDTSLYQVRDLPGSGGHAKILLTLLDPLPKGADNAKFTDDRAANVVDGFSAIFIVLASGDHVLIYNIGIQSKTGSTSMQSTLDAGLKEQYRQFVSFLGADLGIGQAALPAPPR